MTVYITPNKSQNTICQTEKYQNILLGCTMNSDMCWSQGPGQTLYLTKGSIRAQHTAHLGLKRPAYTVHAPPTDKASMKKKSHLKYCSKKKKSFLKYCRQNAFEERLLFLLFFFKGFRESTNPPLGRGTAWFFWQPAFTFLTVTDILCKWKYCPSQINQRVFISPPTRANTRPRSFCPQHLSSDRS